MTQKAFDICSLPEVSFHAIGKPKREQIINFNDYLKQNTKPEKRDDQEWIATAHEYKTITAQIKTLEKRQKQLRDALISMSEHANSIGGGVHLERCERKGSVLYSEIPELRGVDLDAYRGDLITYWKINEV